MNISEKLGATLRMNVSIPREELWTDESVLCSTAKLTNLITVTPQKFGHPGTHIDLLHNILLVVNPPPALHDIDNSLRNLTHTTSVGSGKHQIGWVINSS